jgi:hypothetical protein
VLKKADFDATIALYPTSAEEHVTAHFMREVAGQEGPDCGPLGKEYT